MGNISELDIRLGMIICTPHGEGCIESANRRTNKIEVALDSDIRKLESFKIEDLSLRLGQVHPSVNQEIGDIAIICTRVEQRLKDFICYIFELKNYKQRILLIKDLSLTRCLEKINEVMNDYFQENDKKILVWKTINGELKELVEIRNTLIHGSLYPTLNDDYIFSNTKKISRTKLNPDKFTFSHNKMRKLTNQFYDAYYKNMLFLNSICDEIRTYMNKSDKELMRLIKK